MRISEPSANILANKVSRQTPSDYILEILSCQLAEGGFQLTSAVSQTLGFRIGRLQTAAKKLPATRVDPAVLLHTAVALQILQRCFGAESLLWKGVVQKSVDWYTGVLDEDCPTIDGQDLDEWAAEFVSANVKP